MFLRIIITIVFMLIFTAQNAFCADLRIKDILVDASDNMVLIRGQGNFKTGQTVNYAPTPTSLNTSVNYINNISTFTITSPQRYVIDIPNASLIGSSRNYRLQNSSTIQNIQMAQFSANPAIVRIVFTLNTNATTAKFKTYTNGSDIIVKYADSIVENSIQYKFYTPSGDMDKTAGLQNTSATVTYNNNDEILEMVPRLQTKYYLGQVSQNSDGLILRGIGSISFQRAVYSEDNTNASLILDNASLSSKLDNKSYNIPSSDKEIKTTLTINRINSRKVKLTLNGENLRDYRFVVSPDGQSLFISHRSYIINTIFSSDSARVNSYNVSKTSTGYKIFDFNFNQPVTYDVFELGDNFYIDINNLGDYNLYAFQEFLKDADVNIQAIKISTDKTRFVIPAYNLNFAYANVESNSKSIKLCFKEKTTLQKPQINTNEIVIADSSKTTTDDNLKNTKNETKIEGKSTSGNIDVLYIPKEEDIKPQKPKKKKENPTISSMKKVVIDPGHGGSDCGAIGGIYYEKTINLEVAKLVQEKLAKKDIYVYMTRSKDETLTLEERVEYSNEINPDIFVSIHTNSTVNTDITGLEVHYFKDDSLELAQKIHDQFANDKNLKKWDTNDRGIIKSRFYVINHTENPAVLIEIGFLSNPSERVKLLSKDRQEEIAASIVKGILEYLKSNGK